MNKYPAISQLPTSSSTEDKNYDEWSKLGFPRIDENITYENFFTNHLLANKPCIFGSSVTSNWNCIQEWVRSDGTPNFQFIKERFGEVCIHVADCDQEEFSSHPKKDMKLSDYIEYIDKYRRNGYSTYDKCLYLKDWHFTRDFPDYKAYKTPVYFSSDWLNEFWDVRDDIVDDYRFVYIGPKGSWTSFHSDVFRSYSWSANICGRKKWIFFPPGEERNLKDKFGNLIYDVTEPIDQSKYVNASEVKHKFVIIQESGEIIFVPSGWHHQVFNMEDTISINHNWLNGCCIDKSWSFIKSSLLEVEKEISDCRDMENWHQQCQLILKASSGINYIEFFQFMSTIATHRLAELLKLGDTKRKNSQACQGSFCKSLVANDNKRDADEKLDLCSNIMDCSKSDLYHWRYVNMNHARYDLNCVKYIISDMLKQPGFLTLIEESKEYCDIKLQMEDLILRIESDNLKCDNDTGVS